MIKRIIAVMAALLLALTLPAAPAECEGGDFRIITTIFPPYDFARAVIGDGAQIRALLPPGSEAHTYEPSPGDILEIQSCDLFIYIGGESEAWVDRILSGLNTENMRIVRLMDCVDAICEQDHDHDHSGHDHDHMDEHIWTSLPNAIAMLDAIAGAICEIDPGNAGIYAENAAAYAAELSEIDSGFRSAVAGGARNLIVFGDRFPFRYFVSEYGLDYYSAYPGCTTSMEPSAATIYELIGLIEDKNIPVVFYVEFSNMKVANAIAEQTGVTELLMHSCHNVSSEDYAAGVTFADIMRANLNALTQALN